MDRLGEIKRDRRRRRSRLGPRAVRVDGAGRALGARRRRRRPSTLPARSPEVETDNPVFVPPFLGSQVVKGIAARRHRRLPQRDRAVPQPVAVPAREGRRETDDEFKDRIRPMLRERAGRGQGRRPPHPPGRLRLLPGQRRRQRPRDLERRDPHRRAGRGSRFPRQTQGAVPLHRRLLPAGRLAARSTTPPSTSSPWAPAVSRAHRRAVRRRQVPGLPAAPRPRRRDGRGAGRAAGTAASARSGASPTRTARRSPGLFRQQYRGGRYSWGYPACPDLEDNAKVAELLGADRIGVEVQRGDRLPVPARADHLGASSATTPRPSTSSPAEATSHTAVDVPPPRPTTERVRHARAAPGRRRRPLDRHGGRGRRALPDPAVLPVARASHLPRHPRDQHHGAQRRRATPGSASPSTGPETSC